MFPLLDGKPAYSRTALKISWITEVCTKKVIPFLKLVVSHG